MPCTFRPRRLWSVLILVLVATSVWVSADIPAPASVTFLHLNDVYELDGAEQGRVGGLARVATIIDRLRRQGPTLVTHGGDYLSPSPIGTARVDGQPLAGKQMVDVLNAIGLQWAVLGNHEFDVSEAAFQERLGESRFQIVASNVTDASGALFPKTIRSGIATLRSSGRTIRIGFIGLTIDSARRSWVRYTDPIEAASREVAALRGRVDAIVALTHLSIPTDQRLAEAVPDIDVILGGHEHENWLLRRGAGFTPIVKADANARSVAVLTMTLPGEGGRPTVSVRHQVVDTRTVAKPSVAQIVARWTRTAFDAFARDGFNPTRVIATTTEPLDGRESVVRNRAGLVSDIVLAAVVREASPIDVGVANGGSIRIDDIIPSGPITEYDTIRLLPFGGKVLSASLDGAVLAEFLEVGAANAGTGGFLHVFGAQRTTNGWVVGGQPIEPSRRYRVAMPEFLLTGGETGMPFMTRTNPQIRDVREHRDIRLALIDELARRFK